MISFSLLINISRLYNVAAAYTSASVAHESVDPFVLLFFEICSSKFPSYQALILFLVVKHVLHHSLFNGMVLTFSVVHGL